MAELAQALNSRSRAQAMSGIADFALAAPERKASREAAKQRQAQGEQTLQQNQMTLDKQKALAPQQLSAEMQQLELQQLQTNKLFAELAKGTAFSAFGRYEADGNVRHLNTMLQDLKQNPAGANLLPDVVRLDQITASNPQDDELLQQFGIQDVEGFHADEKIQERFVKATLANGATQIQDMGELFVGSGYAKYMKDANIDMLLDQSLIAQRMQSKSNPSSALEREIALVMEEQPDIDREEAANIAKGRLGKGSEAERLSTSTGDTVAASKEALRAAPSEERNQLKVDEAKANLDEHFGGDFQFADLSDLSKEDRVKIDQNLRRLEKVGGLELSVADRKSLQDIAQLTILGDPTSKITSSETGILDRMFNTAKKYVSDEVGGVEATSAYAAFRNSVRHALFGSALTEAEIKSFSEAFGTLGQQAGPVMQQFVTALTQVKGKLQSIADTNDPYVIKARVGKSQEELEDMIFEIEERVKQFSVIVPKVSIGEDGKVTKVPIDNRKSLTDIFSEVE
jgi:hypothetical protein